MLSNLFQPILIIATLFVALVAGLVFTFAIITMPGIKSLSDAEFIRAFQVMDGIIQNNQPLFMLVWMGSMIMMLIAAVLGFIHLEGAQRGILIAAAVLYFLGVQAPTIGINIPLNNEIQAVNVETLDESSQQQVRAKFENRWNLSNQFRTVIAVLVTVLLLIVILLL